MAETIQAAGLAGFSGFAIRRALLHALGYDGAVQLDDALVEVSFEQPGAMQRKATTVYATDAPSRSSWA